MVGLRSTYSPTARPPRYALLRKAAERGVYRDGSSHPSSCPPRGMGGAPRLERRRQRVLRSPAAAADAFIAATVGTGPQSTSEVVQLRLPAAVARRRDARRRQAHDAVRREQPGRRDGARLLHGGRLGRRLRRRPQRDPGGPQRRERDHHVARRRRAPSRRPAGAASPGVFQSTGSGTYRETDCTISFTYQQEAVPDNPPIAAGRIWGHISCPTAQVAGQTVMLPDGGTQNRQCDAEADFLFEQCGL